MANVLKKIVVSNPLINFEMHAHAEMYDCIENDEEMAAFYHHLLDIADHYENQGIDRPLYRSMIYAMIAYSTDCNINAQMLLL
ncbi:hypothetical protein [Leeuwenhoekiella nanhaiensis]|uniref:Uncharacterized protein n=1 Tax=Leeuwenhoekiella nanhaiensis TaxID=1655491 RepID=A0A2G1VN20_9FLAO|nr:hypothetical protein [Leeuwenhoekiella nanhaiensis]PHQ27879.1 hypothetical protein CJ305_17900 [Leeuwenhoekiella nanhaiensis]